jgi:hypothetical protein
MLKDVSKQKQLYQQQLEQERRQLEDFHKKFYERERQLILEETNILNAELQRLTLHKIQLEEDMKQHQK